jgi:hypothetical protein
MHGRVVVGIELPFSECSVCPVGDVGCINEFIPPPPSRVEERCTSMPPCLEVNKTYSLRLF